MPSPEFIEMSRAAAAPLVAWLLTYAVHSTILLGGAVLFAARIRGHAIREMLWKTALFGGFITATVQSTLRVAPLSGRMVVSVAPPRPSLSAEPGPFPASEEPAALAQQTTPGSAIAPAAGLGLREALVLAWGVGALSLVGLYLIRRARFLRGIAGRRPVMTHPLAALLEQLSHSAGMLRPIRLTVTPGLASPIALGRDEIVVPEAALSELDADQQRGMLAHELAHLDRRDPAWLVAASLAERIAFLQPLNRLARKRIQESAEYLCDEWAVRRTGSGIFLAKCLAKVAEWMDAAPRAVPLAGMAEERSHLVARVRRLLDGAPFSRTPARRTLVTASLVAIGVTVVAVPGVSLARRQADSATSSDAGKAVLSQGSDTSRAVVQALIEAMRDADVEVRRAAVRSLGRFEAAETIPAFRLALRDGDAEVRVAAAEALGERHDRSSAPVLAELLKDESVEVRRAAAGALGEIPRSGTLAPLLAALKDSDAEVRERIIEALSSLKDPGAVEGLLGAIKDPKPDVRAKAIEALTELELESPPAGILEALRDPHPRVRHEAAHAVGHFQDARAVPALRLLIEDPDHEVREAAVEALAEIRNEAAIQALVAALKSKDPKIRRAAADALGQH